MMLDNKIGENEELLKALERALNDYNKATANNRLESSYSELDKDQMKKLKDFEKAYQNITNDLVKNTNKVKETIKDAAKGTGESLKTQLELVDDG